MDLDFIFETQLLLINSSEVFYLCKFNQLENWNTICQAKKNNYEMVNKNWSATTGYLLRTHFCYIYFVFYMVKSPHQLV